MFNAMKRKRPHGRTPRSYFVWVVALAFTVQTHALDGSLVRMQGSDGSAVEFGLAEIQTVYVKAQGAFSQVVLRVDQTTADAIFALSRENLNKQLTIGVCGEVISQSKVSEPITGDEMAVVFDSADKAAAVAALLAGKQSCGDFLQGHDAGS